MRVNITEDEFASSVMTAILRVHHSLKSKDKDLLYDKSMVENLVKHLMGCVGELAVAKCMDKHWPAHVNTYKSLPDLPPDIEVRLRKNNDHDLIVRDGDNPSYKYVLVTGEPPSLYVHGWILGSEAMNKKWLRNFGGYKPAYFIPQKYLNKMETINET